MHAGGQGSAATLVRYVMPNDSSYVLQEDAVYTLPITGGGPIDIAAATSLLWMAINRQASVTHHVKVPGLCQCRVHVSLCAFRCWR